MTSSSSAYRDAGVDIDKKYAAVQGATAAIRSTFTKGVVGDIGLFGGLFDLEAAGAAKGILVASTDGVGTKVKVARMANRLQGVGEDLVNHCVNDILVQGARPLFFLDYIAMGRMVPESVQAVLQGLAKACRENSCALIGGETAEMPGVYVEGEIDVAGTIVGVVERDKVLDGRRIRSGDVLLGLRSSGLHTNGYSLARKVLLQDLGLRLEDRPAKLQGASVADGLLAVHRSYLKPLWPVLQRGLLHGMAHITGGGLVDNVPRVLPKDVAVEIQRDAIPRPPIFDLICEYQGLASDEAYRVLNMGFGMVLFVAEDDVAEVQRLLEQEGEGSWRIGRAVPGAREVRLR